ncbi:MAG: hypothetical protein RLZZ561_1847 [Pseudomonadota bacterium]|jgi:hypothetical protein
MTDTEAPIPKHIWIVGSVSLLWNAIGGLDYVMTQTRNVEYLAQFTDEQRAFFEGFPIWVEFFWAIGVWGAIAGSLLLLLRSRNAVYAFAASLLGLAVNSVWQFGLSGVDMAKVFSGVPMVMTALIWLIAIALLLYAQRQKAAGVLR